MSAFVIAYVPQVEQVDYIEKLHSVDEVTYTEPENNETENKKND